MSSSGSLLADDTVESIVGGPPWPWPWLWPWLALAALHTLDALDTLVALHTLDALAAGTGTDSVTDRPAYPKAPCCCC